MKMLMISKRTIQAKTGKEWTIAEFVSPETLEHVQGFFTPDQVTAFGITDAIVIPEAELKEFFAQYKSVDVGFNARGRIESVEV